MAIPVLNDHIQQEPRERCRLAGQGGHALFIRPTWVQVGDGTIQMAIDVEMLSPHMSIEILGRPCAKNFAKDLAQWFFEVAWDELPEARTLVEYDDEAGFSISCEDSDELEVYLHVCFELRDDFFSDERYIEGMWCTRAALLQAAMDLDSVFDSRFDEEEA